MVTKTFFITGVSSGLGRALATEALAVGHRVVGTVRSEAARTEFEALVPGRSFGRCWR
jgi:NAD(P)-dependent dehydrogenase (short-subunit alcohol dehydrogenase family)